MPRKNALSKATIDQVDYSAQVDKKNDSVNDIERIRKLFVTILEKLESDIEFYGSSNAKEEYRLKWLYGDKESATNTLIKITGCMLKILETEQKLSGEEVKLESSELDESDEEILARFFGIS